MAPSSILSRLFPSRAQELPSTASTSASSDSSNIGCSATPIEYLYDYPTSKRDLEEIVKFVHARLPCVPIKVVRANTLEPDAKVLRMRASDGSNQLIGAVVFKDHPSVEFREVKYFATAFQGSGFGRKLMKTLFEHSVDIGLFFVVLYASNTAVQFFTKQSFVNFPDQVCGLSKPVVLSRVEQYQRSTLMAADLLEMFPRSKFSTGFVKMKVGDEVFVSHGIRHARDEEGVIVETQGDLKVKVHYPKWTSDYDEWVVTGAQRIRKRSSDTPTESVPVEPVEVAVEPPTLVSRIKRIRII